MRSRSRIVSSPNFQKSFSNADEGEEGVGFEMLLPRLLLSPRLFPFVCKGKAEEGGRVERRREKFLGVISKGKWRDLQEKPSLMKVRRGGGGRKGRAGAHSGHTNEME